MIFLWYQHYIPLYNILTYSHYIHIILIPVVYPHHHGFSQTGFRQDLLTGAALDDASYREADRETRGTRRPMTRGGETLGSSVLTLHVLVGGLEHEFYDFPY